MSHAGTYDFSTSPRRPLGLAHALVLGLVWLTFATSAIVFTEPAPYDALMLGLFLCLPLFGLVRFDTLLTVHLLIWLLISAGAFVAVTQSYMIDKAGTHAAVTLFLALTGALISAFVAANPKRHVRLIMAGYTFAALLAIGAATVGYFKLFPGAYELFTEYSRARGTFKDPNVYGPFLVPVLVHAAHNLLVSPARKILVPATLFVTLFFGILLTFSRGALINAAAALAVYALFAFITAQTNLQRLKLILATALGCVVVLMVVVAALQVDAIRDLYAHRGSLSLGYDVGPEGRFGGQVKAMEMIARAPLGLGGLEFGRFYHNEDVHNVYLSMFLNAGWIGGFCYLFVVLATLLGGLRHALVRSPLQGQMIVAISSFAGLVGEGFVIDTDHWRNFFVLLGIIWGLMAAYPVTRLTSRGAALHQHGHPFAI